MTVTNIGTAVEIPFTVSLKECIGSGPIVSRQRQAGTAGCDGRRSAGLAFRRDIRAIRQSSAGGCAQLFLPSETGANYVVEATASFFERTNVSTNTAFGGGLDSFD